MCDYGFGPSDTTAAEMVESVQLGLDALPAGVCHLLVSSIGSFLDEWEVPVSARMGILQSLSETSIGSFAFESRAETITDDAITQCRSRLPHRGLRAYLGLESANPWIARYCINKKLSLKAFAAALQKLRQQGVIASANVLLGAPFLTSLESIQDVLTSVSWALAKGADKCNLFPVHVKQGTLLQWLYERGLYSPPSLWSLVEVLRLLGSETVRNKIKFSWYKPYGSINVVCSPTTCSACQSEAIDRLDRFYRTNDYKWIEQLVSLECDCKDLWRAELRAPVSSSIPDRAARAYELIGRRLLSDRPHYLEAVLEEMLDDADKCLQLVRRQGSVSSLLLEVDQYGN